MLRLPEGYQYALLHDENGELTHYVDQSVAVAVRSGVRSAFNKSLVAGVIDENDALVAAVWEAVDGDEYSFDIAVLPEHQGKGIGRVLLEEYLAIPDDVREAYPNIKVVVDVINPILAHMLDRRGFAVSEVAQGHWIMRDKRDVHEPYALPPLADVVGIKTLSQEEAQVLLTSFSQHGYIESAITENGQKATLVLTVDNITPGQPGTAFDAPSPDQLSFTVKAMAVESDRGVQWYQQKQLRWAPEIASSEQADIAQRLLQKGAKPRTSGQEQHGVQRAEDYAEKMLSALFSDDIVRQTRRLKQISSRADYVRMFNDRAGKGRMVSALDMIDAAKSQGFYVDVTEYNTLHIKFDGDYVYEIAYPEDVTAEELMGFKAELEQEQFDNAVVEREKRHKLGLSHTKKLDFLTSPLQTVALENLLAYAQRCERQALVFGEVSAGKVQPEQVVTMAQQSLFNADVSFALKKVLMLTQDSAETILQIQLDPTLPDAKVRELFEALHLEVQQNFKFVRENDPEIRKIQANMAAANAMFSQYVDPEMAAFMAKYREEEPAPVPPDNVSSIRRKR